jgi:hypothetical protein
MKRKFKHGGLFSIMTVLTIYSYIRVKYLLRQLVNVTMAHNNDLCRKSSSFEDIHTNT